MRDSQPALLPTSCALVWSLTDGQPVRLCAMFVQDDCKWSGSVMYDMFMGVEHNPRISEWSAAVHSRQSKCPQRASCGESVE